MHVCGHGRVRRLSAPLLETQAGANWRHSFREMRPTERIGSKCRSCEESESLQEHAPANRLSQCNQGDGKDHQQAPA
jgi:hypothetical protein